MDVDLTIGEPAAFVAELRSRLGRGEFTHHPSIQSVEAAITNTISAARYCWSGISTKTTIDSTNRIVVRTFGTLKIVLDDE